jgi:hypothetical protein
MLSGFSWSSRASSGTTKSSSSGLGDFVIDVSIEPVRSSVALMEACAGRGQEKYAGGGKAMGLLDEHGARQLRLGVRER